VLRDDVAHFQRGFHHLDVRLAVVGGVDDDAVQLDVTRFEQRLRPLVEVLLDGVHPRVLLSRVHALNRPSGPIPLTIPRATLAEHVRTPPEIT